jgi:hypothetical protein
VDKTALIIAVAAFAVALIIMVIAVKYRMVQNAKTAGVQPHTMKVLAEESTEYKGVEANTIDDS